jgi:hypothetical protein
MTPWGSLKARIGIFAQFYLKESGEATGLINSVQSKIKVVIKELRKDDYAKGVLKKPPTFRNKVTKPPPQSGWLYFSNGTQKMSRSSSYGCH